MARCSTPADLRKPVPDDVYSRPIDAILHTVLVASPGMALLLVSFAAATILPLSSEVTLLGAMTCGMPSWEAVFWASVGNVAGVLFNYWLGRWGGERISRVPSTGAWYRRAVGWAERTGRWSLLLSWLPFVGDPMTVVAGTLRVDLRFFVVVAGGARVARYAVLAWLAGPGRLTIPFHHA